MTPKLTWGALYRTNTRSSSVAGPGPSSQDASLLTLVPSSARSTVAIFRCTRPMLMESPSDKRSSDRSHHALSPHVSDSRSDRRVPRRHRPRAHASSKRRCSSSRRQRSTIAWVTVCRPGQIASAGVIPPEPSEQRAQVRRRGVPSSTTPTSVNAARPEEPQHMRPSEPSNDTTP